MFDSVRGYKYQMGFKINNQAIPDPSKFSGKVSDLDASAGRSANGLLHRQKVAQKNPIKIEYTCIEWEMMQNILSLLNTDQFEFTFPSPLTVNGTMTMTAYVGDRDWDVNLIKDGVYYGDLKFSVIEY